MDFPLPTWVTDDFLHDRFFLRLTSVYIAPTGTLRTVADALQTNHTTLKSVVSKTRGRMLTQRELDEVMLLLARSIRRA